LDSLFAFKPPSDVDKVDFLPLEGGGPKGVRSELM
jgi:hypothetical protein